MTVYTIPLINSIIPTCSLPSRKSSFSQKHEFQSSWKTETLDIANSMREVRHSFGESRMRYEKWKRSSSHKIEYFSRMSLEIFSGTISVSSKISNRKGKSRKQKYSNDAGRSSPNDSMAMVRIMETGMQWKRCRKSDFRRNLILTVNIIWFI